MKVLIVGAGGLVGSHLLTALQTAGHEVIGTYANHPRPGLVGLDIRDPSAVARCIEQIGPEVVYLPASLTHVDYCENHVEESFAVNVVGVRNVAAVAARIVYFSSDYVFDGRNGPYRETAKAHPLNVYGRHKLLAERSLRRQDLIIRTTVVFGHEPEGRNFIERLRRALAQGHTLVVPSDQIGTPTYAPNLARAAVALADLGESGVFHVAGCGVVSRDDFAREAARTFELSPGLIQSSLTSDFNQTARRPLRAGLVCDRAGGRLRFSLIDYRTGLRQYREETARVRSEDQTTVST